MRGSISISPFGTLLHMFFCSTVHNYRLISSTHQANLKFPPNWHVFQCPNTGYFMLILLCNSMCNIVHSSMGLKIKTHISNNANLGWYTLHMSRYNGCWNIQGESKQGDPRITCVALCSGSRTTMWPLFRKSFFERILTFIWPLYVTFTLLTN